MKLFLCILLAAASCLTAVFVFDGPGWAGYLAFLMTFHACWWEEG